MKKMILFALGLMVISLGSCKKEKNDEHITINVNTNVSDEKLDNKSGGVYFISTLVGEYIFRVNLKNGDNNMVCDMLHNEVYSKLPGQKTEWIPGEELNDYEFSAYGVKLILDIDELGTAQARVIIGEKEYETVVFKSTKEEPVKVYYGTSSTRVYIEESNGKISDDSFKEENKVLILQKNKYYYGIKQINHSTYEYINNENYMIGDVIGIEYENTLDIDLLKINGYYGYDNIGWLNMKNSKNEIITFPLDKNGNIIYYKENFNEYSENIIQNFNMPLRFQD